MSRIDELKKQYPELNISMFDLLNRMDTSKTYKYIPLLCKIFGERFNAEKQLGISIKRQIDNTKDELIEGLTNKGIECSDLPISQLYTLNQFADFYNYEMFTIVKEFIERMDKHQIENRDVTSYPNLDSLRTAVSLASLKELDKELESQVIKEYEDEKWLVVRPLTFQSSVKYGASTRWCTTYQREKNYFAKYWKRGILVYFINKLDGYKFAGYKGLDGDNELSFWNATDNRVDYLDVQADDYLFPIVKRIMSSTKTNKHFCSEELAFSVLKECEYYELKDNGINEVGEVGIEQPMMEMREEIPNLHTLSARIMNGYLESINQVQELREEIMEMEVQSEMVTPRNYGEDIPTMRA